MENLEVYGGPISEKDRQKVFKVRVKRTIDFAALKSYAKERFPFLQNSVKIRRNLKHRNIAEFHGWYETKEHLWVVEELCCGGSLKQVHEMDRRLPLATIRQFGRDLLQGLYYLHSHGIIYHDLRPSTVLVNEFGVLKLCNFEHATRIPQNCLSLLTPAKEFAAQLLTKPAVYMAPELLHVLPAKDGSNRVLPGVHSFASDLWALGCVLFQLYFGQVPFPTESSTTVERNSKSLLAQISEDDPFPAVQNIGDGSFEERALLLDLLRRLLCKNPHRRISWPELNSHSFWNTSDGNHSNDDSIPSTVTLSVVPSIELPPQPAWSQYLEMFDSMSGSTNSTSDDEGDQSKPAQAGDDLAGSKTSDCPPREAMTVPLSDDELESTLSQLLQMMVVIHLRLFSSSDAQDTLRQQCIKAAFVWREKSHSDDKDGSDDCTAIISQDLIQHYVEKTLLMCKSDKVVSPIIDTARLQQELSANVRWKALPSGDGVDHQNLDQIQNLPREELSRYLGKIFEHGLSSDEVHASVRENALNFLSYMAVQSTRLASVLANSSVLEFCVHVMTTNSGRVSESLIQAAAVLLGAIFSQASDIRVRPESDQLVPATSVQLALSLLLKHENADVRHAAVGALGELLFYVCTLEDPVDNEDGNSRSKLRWIFPRPIFARLARVLKEDPDITNMLQVAHILENLFISANSRRHRHMQQNTRTPPSSVAQLALAEFAVLPIALTLLRLFAGKGQTTAQTNSSSSGNDARVKASLKAVAGNALFQMLTYKPALISKVFEMDHIEVHSNKASSGGLGSAAAKGLGYADVHGRRQHNKVEKDIFADEDATVVHLADKDELLLKCALNIFLLILSQQAVFGHIADSEHAILGGCDHVAYSEAMAAQTPIALSKVRASLLRNQHRIVTALIKLLFPTPTRNMMVVASETIQAKAALVLRQFLSLDSGSATVLNHACQPQLDLCAKLDNLLVRAARKRSDDKGTSETEPVLQRPIQSPYCKAAQCLLADRVASILHEGLQSIKTAATASITSAFPAPATLRKLKLFKRVSSLPAVAKVAFDYRFVHDSVTERLHTVAKVQGQVRPPPVSIQVLCCSLVKRLAMIIPGAILSADLSKHNAAAASTLLGSPDDAVSIWSSLTELAEALVFNNSTKLDVKHFVAGLLIPSLCHVSAVTCGAVMTTTDFFKQKSISALTEKTLDQVLSFVDHTASSLSPEVGSILVKHLVPVCTTYISSLLQFARQQAIESKQESKSEQPKNHGAPLFSSVDVLLSIFQVLLATKQPCRQATEGVRVTLVVILAMISSGLLGDGLGFLMGWRDVNKSLAPKASNIMYLAVTHLLTPTLRDTGTLENRSWTKSQQELVTGLASSPRWCEATMLKALSAANGAGGNGNGSAAVTSMVLLRPPFQIMGTIANAFSVKIRQADTSAIQLLHCVITAAIGRGTGLVMGHGLQLGGGMFGSFSENISLQNTDAGALSLSYAAGPTLKAALRQHILKKHCDALIRILTLNKESIHHEHLSRSDGPAPAAATTFAFLALECLSLLAIWFQDESELSSTGFSTALLSTISKPDKSCARLLSTLACFTSSETQTEGNNSSQHGEVSDVSRETAVGTLLLLDATLAKKDIVKKYLVKLRHNNFFVTLHSLLQSVKPKLLDNSPQPRRQALSNLLSSLDARVKKICDKALAK